MRLFKTDLDFGDNIEAGLNPGYAIEKMLSNSDPYLAQNIRIVVRSNNDLSNIEFYGEPVGNEDLTQQEVDQELGFFNENVAQCDEPSLIKLLND